MENIIKRLLENHRLDEMANVSKSDTGLHYDIWIDSVGSDRKGQHHIPRVKVKVGESMIPISISEDPRILAGEDFVRSGEILRWVAKYHEVLLKHWNKELTDREALNLLGK